MSATQVKHSDMHLEELIKQCSGLVCNCLSMSVCCCIQHECDVFTENPTWSVCCTNDINVFV